jgi:uncharacterized protein YbjT (DUF2867 family)
MKIVVIGGTGLIGSKLVQMLKQRGHDAFAPCDGAWPAEHVSLFAKWVSDGKQP